MIEQANKFIDSLTNPPEKYTDDQMLEFIREFDSMEKLQRYTCLEMLLSTSRRLIDERKFDRAQQYLVLAIPLCIENKFRFQEFDFGIMLKKCWVDQYTINSSKRKENLELLKTTGFSFPQEIEKKPYRRTKNDCCSRCSHFFF